MYVEYYSSFSPICTQDQLFQPLSKRAAIATEITSSSLLEQFITYFLSLVINRFMTCMSDDVQIIHERWDQTQIKMYVI